MFGLEDKNKQKEAGDGLMFKKEQLLAELTFFAIVNQNFCVISKVKRTSTILAEYQCPNSVQCRENNNGLVLHNRPFSSYVLSNSNHWRIYNVL